jgi:gentisate 1,2-dioxygenase
MAAPQFHAPDTDLEDLLAELAAADLQPLWLQTGLLPATPSSLTPHVWRWTTLQRLAERAGELVGIDRGGDRRVLALSHPGLGGLPFATPTLWAAVQYLNAGEHAPAHRHSPAALRFVMQGAGVWTLVNGDAILMEPGDLVLTPSYCWHEHDNPGDEPMIWFDGLDLPLVRNLDAIFFEPGPDHVTPYERSSESRSEKLYGAGLVPVGPQRAEVERPNSGMHSPLFAYRWSRTDAHLRSQLSGGTAAAAVRFTDPTNGRDIMPTLRAELHRVQPGHRTSTTRTVGSSVWLVHRGVGATVIDGIRYPWSAGDIFVVPSWAAWDHEAYEPCDLFLLSDAPVIEALGLGRCEVQSHHQDVTGEGTA